MSTCFRGLVGRITRHRRSVAGMVMAVLLGVWARPAGAQAVPARPLGASLPVFRPDVAATGAAEPRTVVNPTGPLTLREALALTLIQSPELAAYAWEVRAQESRILQAGRLPNPVLSAALEDLGASAPGTPGDGVIQPQTTIQMSQLVELGGKRTARQHLAQLNRALAEWDYEMARLDVFTRVTRTFIDVLASQQAVILTGQTMQLVEQTQETVRARVTAGVVSPIEQTKAEVALASARIEVERAHRALEADKRRLAALWGAADAAFESAAGDLTVLPPVPPFEALVARLAESPELARWVAEMAQRQAAFALERSRRVPDVTLSAGYRRYTRADSPAFLVGGAIPLPLFDKNPGGIREAADRIARAQEEQRSAQVRAIAGLADAYRLLATAQNEATAIGFQVLPGAQAAFDAISEGYRLGKFGYLDVLDGQRTLVGARAQYHRALADFHKAAADVERLTGMPLGGVGAPPTVK